MLGRLLSSERGSITIALTVAIIATMSGLTLASLGYRDANVLALQMDSLEEFHLVRTEIQRGNEIVEGFESFVNAEQLPYRKIEINHGFDRRTYVSKTVVSNRLANGDVTVSSRKQIRTKVKAFNRDADYTYYGTSLNKSMVEKYAYKNIQKETFAGFMYLTNCDQSVNGDADPVWFYGADEIWGRVHSNTGIHIENAGGGWPVFHGFVTTADEFYYQGGTPDENEVFLGGHQDHYGTVIFNPTAELIRANGKRYWDEGDEGVDLVCVDLNGAGFNSYTGNIVEESPRQMVLYDSYPPFGPVGDSIGVYTIALTDTVWSPSFSDAVSNKSVMCFDELWLRGSVTGAQTWGSSKNIYLIGDLTYTGTSMGMPADGILDSDEVEYPVNNTDYLGVVSEQSVIIRYGILDPADSTLKHVNCGNAEGAHHGIYIYGALCALQDAQDTHLDGVFTFQYQHPHRSTPNCYYGGELFNFVDLHLGKYPPSPPMQAWPYPAATAAGFNYPATYGGPAWPDYPWYNPIWPEAVPYMERGTINLFGAVAQTRRGFVHRSRMDTADMGVWNLTSAWMYGQSCAGLGTDAPGVEDVSNGGVGYAKAYHYDTRFINNPPPDFPEVNLEGGTTSYRGTALTFSRPPTDAEF